MSSLWPAVQPGVAGEARLRVHESLRHQARSVQFEQTTRSPRSAPLRSTQQPPALVALVKSLTKFKTQNPSKADTEVLESNPHHDEVVRAVQAARQAGREGRGGVPEAPSPMRAPRADQVHQNQFLINLLNLHLLLFSTAARMCFSSFWTSRMRQRTCFRLWPCPG